MKARESESVQADRRKTRALLRQALLTHPEFYAALFPAPAGRMPKQHHAAPQTSLGGR